MINEAQNERALSLQGRGCGYFRAVWAEVSPVEIFAVADRIAQIINERLEDSAILLAIVEGAAAQRRVDLSDIDFGALAKPFETSSQMAVARLQQEAEQAAKKMERKNACWFEGKCGRANLQNSKAARPCPTFTTATIATVWERLWERTPTEAEKYRKNR